MEKRNESNQTSESKNGKSRQSTTDVCIQRKTTWIIINDDDDDNGVLDMIGKIVENFHVELQQQQQQKMYIVVVVWSS